MSLSIPHIVRIGPSIIMLEQLIAHKLKLYRQQPMPAGCFLTF